MSENQPPSYAATIDLDNPNIQQSLNDTFMENMRHILCDGPLMAQESLIQIASVLSKHRDPFVLKCMLAFLDRTQNNFRPLKKPMKFFPLLTNQLSTDNEIIHSFIFQAVKIFANSISPELPVLNQIIRGCKSDNLEKQMSAKRCAMELCTNYDYFCFQIIKELKMPYVIDIIPYLTRSYPVMHASVKLIDTHMYSNYPYLIDLIDHTIQYIIKAGHFPLSTFYLLIQILNEQKEDESFIHLILKKIRPTVKFFVPQQKEAMLEFCKEMISHYHVISPYLKIISLMNITDPFLQTIDADSLSTLISLIYVLPRTEEWGAKIMDKVQQFKNELKIPKFFTNTMRALNQYQKVLSYDCHSQISNIFLELVMISSAHQDAIGEFINDVSIQCASAYIELSDAVQTATEKLKLGMAKISFSLETDPNANFIPSDPGQLGIVAFQIGQYQQASHYFNNRRGNGFYDSLKLFTDGELSFLAGDYSAAALLYGQAESAFRIAGEMYSMHSILSKIRFLQSSLCLQLSFFKMVPNGADIVQCLDGFTELMNLTEIFPSYSILISPQFCLASSECAQNISHISSEIREILQEPNVDALFDIISKFRPVPPAFFRQDFPISVTGLRLLNTETHVPKVGDLMVGIDVDGTIVNEDYKDAELLVQVSHGNRYDYSTPTVIPSSGRFYVHEGISLFRKPECDRYEMDIDVWVEAKLKSSSISYIITRTKLKLPIVEDN